MNRYVSTNGGIDPVSFEEAILQGKPEDGGLFVPENLPVISLQDLESWQPLKFTELAFRILTRFIRQEDMDYDDLQELIIRSFESFDHPDTIPSFLLSGSEGLYLQELFHGPTLSFKDVAMGFIVNLVEYFLNKRNQFATLVVATTGDTGPAAAYASARKNHIETWVFYPQELITEEQRRQMTTIHAGNVHAAGITNCPDGADDLDLLISEMFNDAKLKDTLRLSSVNSINWGRVMMQTVHYFYGYLNTVDRIGEQITISVPSGAFGNLCAGSIARFMGLPIETFIVANNRNACLHRIFSQGLFEKRQILGCPSSAIDILIPINFWRYLYFASGKKHKSIKKWMDEFNSKGKVAFDTSIHKIISTGFMSESIEDEDTYSTMRSIFKDHGYILDPHAAVAVAAAKKLKVKNHITSKILCLATAHPSKFYDVLLHVFGDKLDSINYSHPSIEKIRSMIEKSHNFGYNTMRSEIPKTMLTHSSFLQNR